MTPKIEKTVHQHEGSTPTVAESVLEGTAGNRSAGAWFDTSETARDGYFAGRYTFDSSESSGI